MTIFSRIDGSSSSSSGLQRILPIYANVSPLVAPFLRSVEDIRMFIRHSGRNLKLVSSIIRSALTLMLLMYFNDFSENGFSAWAHDSQYRSYVQIDNLSGNDIP